MRDRRHRVDACLLSFPFFRFGEIGDHMLGKFLDLLPGPFALRDEESGQDEKRTDDEGHGRQMLRAALKESKDAMMNSHEFIDRIEEIERADSNHHQADTAEKRESLRVV